MTRHQATEQTTVGSAPSRLCLGGEDLDWMGGPALLTAIDLTVDVTFDRRPAATSLDIRSRGTLRANLALTDSSWFNPTDSALELARLCWQHAHDSNGLRLTGGRLAINSAVPPSAGLASSATTCVAVLRAVRPTHPLGASSAVHLVRAAYHVERELAGRPVGPMDFVPAAFGGTTLVRTDSERISELTQLALPAEARFLVVDTRTPRDTGAVIAWKRRRYAQRETGIRHYARGMAELVAEQADLLSAACDLDALGQTLDAAQTLLCHQLAVSTPLIDTCAARLRANGALGVKLTGTGLGGCVFALTTVDADNDRLASCLADLPVGVTLVRPAGPVAIHRTSTTATGTSPSRA